MSDLYRDSRRCYLIDHHSPAPPAVTLDHLDIAEYEEFFDTAQIDSVMVYCKDHWGMTYFDSKVPGSMKESRATGSALSVILLHAKILNLLLITASNMMKELHVVFLNGAYARPMAHHLSVMTSMQNGVCAAIRPVIVNTACPIWKKLFGIITRMHSLWTSSVLPSATASTAAVNSVRCSAMISRKQMKI